MNFMRRIAALLVLIIGVLHAQAPKGIVGFWREPQGSVLEVYPCGEDICARIAFVRKDAPSQFDRNNPDESLRNTPLCGMQIGRGFHPLNAEHADAGKLYDPKTGKTYDGEMTAEGDALHLRGYLGIKAFGRTQDWTRTTAVNCADNH